MKATGIVRRIDELGRVVIPKEIRRTMRIREGDPLEIFVDRDGEVILKKYSPIGELGDIAKEYVDSLYEATGHITCITDRDAVVAVAGASKKQFIDKRISQDIEHIMEERKAVVINPTEGEADGQRYPILEEDEEVRFPAQVVAPIISEGEPIGAVILSPKEPGTPMGELELKVAETAASFLAKQMGSG